MGAVIGVASGAVVGALNSKKIKKGAAISKKKAQEFYKKALPQLKKIKKVGEAEYRVFMENALKNYSKAKKLSASEAHELRKDIGTYWKEIKKHL